MDSFNLYREAKDNYEKLVPEKNEGLVLLSLYTKFQTGNFTEKDIITIINKVNSDQGRDSGKFDNHRNNSMILRLQETFLWRDEINRSYQFKRYGLDFCSSIEKRLADNYSPAKIKRWFDELYTSLSTNFETGGDFNVWVEDHFDLRKPMLSNQIEILDQQVSESVQQFKEGIKKEHSSILELLRQIEYGLNIIKDQASELRNAFQASYDIDDLMTSILERQGAAEFVSNIKKVQDFHDLSRGQLEQVSKRIDKIKPRIREFIYNFNKKELDRKTEKFLRYLLEHSRVQREGTARIIMLPPDIPKIRVKSSENLLRFTTLPNREIAERAPQVLQQRKIDTVKRQALVEKARAWQHEKNRIAYWTEAAFAQIQKFGALDYASFFFRIVNEENFAIAVKSTSSILKKCMRNKQGYAVTVDDKTISNYPENTISIWKMRIAMQP